MAYVARITNKSFADYKYSQLYDTITKVLWLIKMVEQSHAISWHDFLFISYFEKKVLAFTLDNLTHLALI